MQTQGKNDPSLSSLDALIGQFYLTMEVTLFITL